MLRTMPNRILELQATTVEEVMTDSPLSIHESSSAQEAIKLFSEHKFSAAPVINEVGHPVGVISKSDLLFRLLSPRPQQSLDEDWFECGNILTSEPEMDVVIHSHQLERTTIGDLMTPMVVSVSPDDAVEHAIGVLTTRNIHRLFVVDRDNVLVGVLSATDVLKHLHPHG